MKSQRQHLQFHFTGFGGINWTQLLTLANKPRSPLPSLSFCEGCNYSIMSSFDGGIENEWQLITALRLMWALLLISALNASNDAGNKEYRYSILWWHQRGDSLKPTLPTLRFEKNLTSPIALQWRHNERYGASNQQLHNCLLNRLFGRRKKENIRALCHWPLWGKFTGDRWIPRTNGQ